MTVFQQKNYLKSEKIYEKKIFLWDYKATFRCDTALDYHGSFLKKNIKKVKKKNEKKNEKKKFHLDYKAFLCCDTSLDYHGTFQKKKKMEKSEKKNENKKSIRIIKFPFAVTPLLVIKARTKKKKKKVKQKSIFFSLHWDNIAFL